jgi:GDP-L-fucose synthase
MSDFWQNRPVLVTGGNGFLGSVVVQQFRAAGATVSAPHKAEFDLTVPGEATRMLAQYAPSHVVHLAARVGGIGYNQVAPAPLYLDNLLMGTHVIEACRHAQVEKTIVLGTVCSYPKFTPVPFHERSLWDGYPEETNAPYGIAKKALLVHAQVNAAQYGQKFAYLIPTNLFGPGDKFHVLKQKSVATAIFRCGVREVPAANTCTLKMQLPPLCVQQKYAILLNLSTWAITTKSLFVKQWRPLLK